MNTSYAGLYSGMLDGAPVDKKNYMDNFSYQTRAANDKSSVYVNAWGIDRNTFGVGSVVQQSLKMLTIWLITESTLS